MKLYPHQIEVLKHTENKNLVAYYLDMGLGKTFVGSEKMLQLNKRVNLVICQKSKVNDWVEHFKQYYAVYAYDLTNKKDFTDFMFYAPRNEGSFIVGIINYELAFRRPELAKLSDFTLMLDESSLIQNECAKRSKFILKRLQPSNVILLSGTPTSGNYEKLWSQMHLLGWNISKKMYYAQYVDMEISPDGYPIIKGYKNVDRLKRKMREYGCVFMKSEEVLDLPTQNFITVNVPESKEYKKFKKSGIISVKTIGDYCEYTEDDKIANSDFYGKDTTPTITLVGDTTLTKLLYSRMLCGCYNKGKFDAFRDLVESTDDRLIVFYNFNEELEKLKNIVNDFKKPISVINGQTKELRNYEKCNNSVTFVQYQAGSMGLNLQKANRIIYFTPPLSSELFEQSKKRIHRIGQEQACFYYQLTSGIEQRIYDTLSMRKDYTDKLFEEEEQ